MKAKFLMHFCVKEELEESNFDAAGGIMPATVYWPDGLRLLRFTNIPLIWHERDSANFEFPNQHSVHGKQELHRPPHSDTGNSPSSLRTADASRVGTWERRRAEMHRALKSLLLGPSIYDVRTRGGRGGLALADVQFCNLKEDIFI